jgi:hypothetical protein
MNTIDADGHIIEKDIDIRKRLPEPFSNAPALLPSDGMDTNIGSILGGGKNDIQTRLQDMDKGRN